MRKQDINELTKTDMPLDASFSAGSTIKANPSKSTTSKPKIQVIAKKKTSKSTTTTKNNSKAKTEQRTKLKADAIDIENLEKLNEESIKTHRFRGRRNRLILIILAILLTVAVAFIAVYFTVLQLKNNSFAFIYGDVEATYYIGGEELTAFRTPQGVKGNRTYRFDVEVDIGYEGEYNVSFGVKVYQGTTLLDNTIIYMPDWNNFEYRHDGLYHNKEVMSGSQRLYLFAGVVIDDQYENTLNADNFKMEIHTYINKV